MARHAGFKREVLLHVCKVCGLTTDYSEDIVPIPELPDAKVIAFTDEWLHMNGLEPDCEQAMVDKVHER